VTETKISEGFEIKDLVVSEGERDPKDDQIAVLENSVQELTNKNFEERFIWIVVCLILFDTYIFSRMENWSAPVNRYP
jgi:hypothetical protein